MSEPTPRHPNRSYLSSHAKHSILRDNRNPVRRNINFRIHKLIKQMIVVPIAICVMIFGLSLPAQALTEEVVAAGEAFINGDATPNSGNNKQGKADEQGEANDGQAADTTGDSEAAEDGASSDVVDAPVAGNITEKDTTIETSADQVNDEDIKKRISGIYSEIEGLKSVVVSVSQGVVSLTGEVPNEKKAQQAINLANRVSDVVAVEDRISRTLDVQDNVTPVISGIKQLIQGFIQALPLMIVAILVFILVTWFGSWLARRDSLWQRITPNPFVAELVSQTVKVIFIIIALILGLSLMGAEAVIGTLLGGAGVVGIAVGFAVKDTIENYISSLMLSVRQPFQARDFVKINEHQGIVVRLTSRATILMTADGNQLRIPNSEVFKGTILNYTKNPERRFTFKLGVDANDDPLAAIKVGLDAINKLDFVLQDPKALAIIDEVGDSNIILEFQIWVNQTNTDLFKARSIAIREAKNAIEDNGFSLPEPIYRMRFNGEVEDAIKQIKGATLTADTTQPDQSTPSTSKPTPESQPDQIKKTQAKHRAKQILKDKDAEEVLDARPDPKLMQKVEEEIQENKGDKDLLDNNSPQE